MTKMINIWGREFELRVVYDYYDDPVPKAMIDALNDFIAAPECIDISYKYVEQYCLENDGKSIREISKVEGIDNIFRYVMPDYILVLEPSKDEETIHRIALMCDYRFDLEEGLAIIFENEEFARIVPQSSVD